MSDIVLADLIIENVNVITMDPSLPFAQGIAVAKGRIIGMLQSGQESWPLAPDGSRLDGQGMFILPGLIDAHCHLRAVISGNLSVSCGREDAASMDDIIAAIRKQADRVPPGEWVKANGYDPFYIKEKRHPDRFELDQAAADHPVRLRHVTRHVSVLNSFALRLAGIGRTSFDPPGVEVERDPGTKEPTGVIYGGDAWLSQHIVSPLTQSDMETGANVLQAQLLRFGITAVVDATPTNTTDDIAFWHQQITNGWPITIQLMTEARNHDRLAHFLKHEVPGQKQKLQIGAMKVVMEANPDLHPGLDELTRIAMEAAKRDASLAIHVVDPEMVWNAAEAVKRAAETYPDSKSIFRFEHLSLCPEAFLQDINDLNIITVTNPSFIREHGDRYLADVDPSEHGWLYRMKSLLEHGIRLAAGSDAPVASFNPWSGISTAAARRTLSGKSLGSDERLTRLQAIEMYTTGAAQSAGWENCRGKIRKGFHADFIVLQENPLTCPDDYLEKMTVHQTWVEGAIVHSS